MPGIPRVSGVDLLDAGQLRRQHQLVKRFLFTGEATVYREGPGDVGGVTLQFRTGVDQQQIPVPQLGIVLGVMQNAAVGAATDDGRVRGAAPILPKYILQLGFHLKLRSAGPRTAHRPTMGFGRYGAGPAHDLQLRRTLDQPHLVQQMVEADELPWRGDAGACPAAYLIDPGHKTLVEGAVAAHGVVDPIPILQQIGQWIRFSVLDAVRLTGAVSFQCAILPGPTSVPGFHLWVPRPAKQDELAFIATRRQHGNAVGFREAGQVEKVAVLAKWKTHVPIAALLPSGRNHGDGARTHLVHEATPPILVFR